MLSIPYALISLFPLKDLNSNADAQSRLIINTFLNNPANKEQSMDFILHLRLTQKMAEQGKKDLNYLSSLQTKTIHNQNVIQPSKNYYKVLNLPYSTSQSDIDNNLKEEKINLDNYKTYSYEALVTEGEQSSLEKEKSIAFAILSNPSFRSMYDSSTKELLSKDIIQHYVKDLFEDQMRFLKLLWSYRLFIYGIVNVLPPVRANYTPLMKKFLGLQTLQEDFFTQNITTLETLQDTCEELELFTKSIIKLLNPEIKRTFNSWYKKQQK